MCVVESHDEPRRTRGTLVIKLIIFFSVLAFAITLLTIGVEVAAVGAFLPVVVAVAVKAGRGIISDRDGPDDDPAAVTHAA
jgi:hypothetical protein